MRIAFLTGCLEPGKDGVGDYTRYLAGQCQDLGNVACTLALNDCFVSSQPEPADNSLLRLSSSLPWETRLPIAQEFLENFNPDCISLQFVPYAFHPKGIVRGFGKWIEQLVQGRRIQIMFHELWIGAQKGARIKEWGVGYLQRFYIHKMVNRLRPALIHTSNKVYQELLARDQMESELLPLFGQIPVQESPQSDWLYQSLSAAGIPISECNRQQFWLIGFFGELPSIWPPEPLFSLLKEAGQTHRQKIVILSAGKLRSGHWAVLADQYRKTFSFCLVGERSPEQISEYLHFLDFGIATTPEAIVTKSGSFAAMQDHGLPVIVNRDDLEFSPMIPTSPLPTGAWKLEPDLSIRLPALLDKHPRPSTLPAVASKFLSDLSTHALKSG